MPGDRPSARPGTWPYLAAIATTLLVREARGLALDDISEELTAKAASTTAAVHASSPATLPA